MKKEDIYKIFSATPTITTEQLVLRAMHPTDAEDMYAYARREDVTRYLLWSPHPDIEYTKKYLGYVQNRYALGDFYDWAVVEKKSGRMIGTCGFARIDTANDSAELGYVLNPDFHRLGYGYEMAKRVMEFGFDALGLHRIEARFMQGNEASFALMKKLGMEFEGYRRDSIFVKGAYRTVGGCAIIKRNDTGVKIK